MAVGSVWQGLLLYLSHLTEVMKPQCNAFSLPPELGARVDAIAKTFTHIIRLVLCRAGLVFSSSTFH
jgi:hypothetical protein